MSKITALKEQRAKLMADATKLIQQPEITTETRAQADKMLADVDVIEADIAREERVAAFEAERRAATRPPREQFTNTNTDEEKRALTHYLATGERRDLLASGNGGVLIPERMYGTVLQAQKAYGALLANLKQDNGPAGPMRLPIADDRMNLLTPASEPAVTAEADPLLTSVESTTELMKTNWVKYSLQLLNRSGFDLDGFISGLFDKRFWRGLTQMVSNGTASGSVQSIYSTSAVGATALSANAVGYADLVSLFSSLEESYQPNASWVMSSTMRNSLIGVTDTLGRPLFIPSPNDGGLDRLLGHTIIINKYAPATAASAKTILYGDLSEGYLLRVPNSLSIYRTTDRFIDTAEIGLIGFAECGGVATNAGDNPIVALQMKASS